MIPKDNLLIADSKVTQIPVKDNSDRLVDLRNYPDFIIDQRKSKDQNEYFKIRKTVAEKLINAQKNLPNGYRFLIIEGYRPLKLQEQYFDKYSTELKLSHPEWTQQEIYNEVCKFVAPPEQKPPHCTGGAIDLTLLSPFGREVDMGVAVNADPDNSKNKCFTLSENISELAKNNRKILNDALSDEGFVNYQFEFWHWSYGDQWWAYQTKNPNAIYDIIK